MKAKEIRSSEKTTLNDKLVELKKELVKMNAQIAVGTAIKSPGQVKKIKKTIARVITIQQERKSRAKEKLRGLVKKHE
ncbi:50S ribosomal protein L29 [Candidatus Woesearchaeota archaeon]|jgi:large subunit ribosomal protein L29|nr:50S ribosomal protein L29 [Candidatus Woesearchaeota archaeon]|tara:strand:+ start:5332 stop:5565 length:234 start_codon:yes stop_codon:yes gene_type:complete